MPTIGRSGAQAYCTCSSQPHTRTEADTGPPNMSSSRGSLKHLDDARSLETQPGPPHKRSIIRSFLPMALRSCCSVLPLPPHTAVLGRWAAENALRLTTAVPLSKPWQPWLTRGHVAIHRDDQQASRVGRCCRPQQRRSRFPRTRTIIFCRASSSDSVVGGRDGWCCFLARCWRPEGRRGRRKDT